MKAAALFPSKLAWCLSVALGAGALPPQALAQAPAATAPVSSDMDGELFYQLLLGELQVRGGEPGAGYPKERAAIMAVNRGKLADLKAASCHDMLTVLQNVDQDLLRAAIAGDKFAEYYYPNSQDEQVVLSVLTNPADKDFPDLVVVVVDASNLKRNLLLFSQVRDLGIPTVLALNMIDVAENEGYVINSIKLARELNVEVAEVNAKRGIGLNGLKLAVVKSLANRYASNDALPLPVAEELIQEVQAKFGDGETYRSLLWLMEHDRMKMFSKQQRESFDAIQNKHHFSSKKYQSEETVKRYEQITEVVDRCVINLNRHWDAAPVRTWTDRLDK